MKTKLLTAVLGLSVLTACGATEDAEAKTKYKYPKGYEIVTYTDLFSKTDGIFVELRHINTGCHFTATDGYNSETLEQMFVKENGVSVPYCD